jgi:hypothetical protein
MTLHLAQLRAWSSARDEPGGEVTPTPGFSRAPQSRAHSQNAPGNSGRPSAFDLARTGGRENPLTLAKGAGASRANAVRFSRGCGK